MVERSRYFARDKLKGGTEVTIRAIRPDDGPSLLDAFGKLDRESIYRRFFSPKKELSAADLEQLTEVDFSRVVALVVTMRDDGFETLIAGGRYAVEPGDRPRGGELAFLTGEAYRGRGIAGLLLRHLVLIAQKAGLSRLEADVLAENQPMLNVFRRCGLPMTQRRDGNVVHVTLSLKSGEIPDRGD
jgi:RimJ/RimL family protein N-acetyltransferase